MSEAQAGDATLSPTIPATMSPVDRNQHVVAPALLYETKPHFRVAPAPREVGDSECAHSVRADQTPSEAELGAQTL